MSAASMGAYLASGGMVFGSALPYIPQYLHIRETHKAEGFSTLVCFTLLVSNILRLFFWLCRPFELPLVYQSVVMIAVQLALLHACVRAEVVMRRRAAISARSVSRELVGRAPESDVDEESPHTSVARRRAHSLPKHGVASYFFIVSEPDEKFWEWLAFRNYLTVLLGFTATVTFLTAALGGMRWFVELLGYAALLSEACLGMPQAIKNWRNRSTRGMSLLMLFGWFVGDAFKTGYFIARQAPAQFLACGLLQLLVDMAIFAQYVAYRYRKHAK